MGFMAGDFPEAEAYYAQAISLPLFPAMTDAQQDYVIDQLKRLLVVSDGIVSESTDARHA
jgi:dTDP-4-amino-4,6-dideoxygalactose transaminase